MLNNQLTFERFAAQLGEFIRRSTSYPVVSETYSAYADNDSFNQLALDLFQLQYKANAVFAKFCLSRGKTPQTVSDWREIPCIPTYAFKELDLTSLGANERTRVFHSSGTTERQPSRHFHGAASLAVYEASLLPWFQRHLVPKGTPLRLLILTPCASDAPHSSLAHMMGVVSRCCGKPGSCVAGNVNERGEWGIAMELAKATLDQSLATGEPLALVGTAFGFVHLLDYLAERGSRYELPAGSRIMETGGYKGRSRVIPKPELHQMMTQSLGIDPDGIVCEYGMSELSSQAYDGIAGQKANASSDLRLFQFPPWGRARLVSPETGAEVADGETGLIQVCDLANVWSVMTVQTEDLGVRRGNGFGLLGRATLAEPRGCSLMAS